MLAKKERLSRDAFNRFFSVGKRHHAASFQIVYAPHPTFHASVVVPKKIEKSAVGRNTIRRRIYDILRHYTREQKAHGVFIVIVKQPILKKPYAVLKEEVIQVITPLGTRKS
jgi:ribonuclease P protein component